MLNFRKYQMRDREDQDIWAMVHAHSQQYRQKTDSSSSGNPEESTLLYHMCNQTAEHSVSSRWKQSISSKQVLFMYRSREESLFVFLECNILYTRNPVVLQVLKVERKVSFLIRVGNPRRAYCPSAVGNILVDTLKPTYEWRASKPHYTAINRK